MPSIDASSLKAAADQPSDMLSTQLQELEIPSPGLLSTPVIESSLSSPTFSIGSEEDEEDDESDSGITSKLSNQSSSQVGLGILDSPEQAAREEEMPEVIGNESAEKESENETKAKGQLSEEGELFRKAKSLGLDDEDEDEVDETKSDEAGSSTANSSKQVEGEQAETSISSSTAESTSIGSSTSPPHSHSPNSSVSGEELRKDLLQTELPPSSPSKGAEHDGAKELEAEVAGQIR